jgi:dipeptidyl aminopeptidase/acylaminoacyl peptidase
MRRPYRLVLPALWLVFSAFRADAAELSPDVISDLKMVEDVRISGDGKWVTYIQADETAGPDGRATELWIAPVDGPVAPRRLLPDNAKVSGSRWSRDNRLVVMLTQDRKRQVILLDPLSNESRVLIHGFDGSSLEWSPDGRLLSYTRSDASTGKAAPRRSPNAVQVFDGKAETRQSAVTRFYTFDVASGAEKAMTPAGYSLTGDYAWSPRGDAIVAMARRVSDGGRPSVTIFNFAGETAPRALLQPEDQTNGLAWSPDGMTIAWTGRELAPDSGQLVLMNASGDPRPRTVQKDFPGSIHNIQYLPNGRLAFGALENLRAGIYTVAGDGSDLRGDHAAASFAPGSLGVGSFTKFTVSFSADGRRVASMISGPREPANVVAGEFGGKLSRRTALNPEIAGLRLGTVEEISWRAKDGLQIHGFLVKPADFDPRKKYPMIIEVHGGPRRSWWATCFLNDANWSQWFAHHGYVVLMPNPRGSEGRGAEFARANARDLGGGDWQDVVAGMNHVIGMGFIDRERLGIAGWSYGGYLTARGITQPEGSVFKAAIVGAGITNIFARGGAAGSWAKEHWRDEKLFYREPGIFFDRSPIAHAAKVKAATLLLHGDNDAKVPHSQAVEFYNALTALGIPTEMRIYPGEGHGIGRRENQVDVLNSIARWMTTHIPPGGR